MTRPLLTLLLIAASAASASAQRYSSSASSTAPSPAATSAAASPPVTSPAPRPQDDETLRACELCAARLRAAEAKVAALESIVADKDRQLLAKDELLAIRAQVITELKGNDARSQQMDANAIRADAAATAQVGLLREQVGRDALRITELQGDLDGCRGGQKWIALGSAFGGGVVGYKLRGGAGQQLLTVLNPFTNQSGAFTLTAQPQGLWLTPPQADARTVQMIEEAVRRAKGQHN